LHSIIPEHDLTRISAAQNQIRMESGERSGHNGRLTVKNKL